MCHYSKYIDTYIDMILNNKVNHCQEQEDMINNIVIPVLERDDVHIDDKKIAEGLNLQKYFPYNLIEWEIFLFALIVGVRFKTGAVFFTDIRVLVGRGAGKNGFISFLIFYFISSAHGIQGYHVDLLANSEDQAKRSFEDVYNVIDKPEPENEKAIKANFQATKEKISCRTTQSEIRYNTSSKRGKDSKRTGCVIYDEKHEYLTTENINTLSSGLGKIADCREITITTDGRVRGGVLDKEKEQNRAILKEYNPNNRTLVFWCRIEDESEWNDIDALIKAIPSLNDFAPLRDRIQAEILKMPSTPDYYYEFLAKRCNFPVQQSASAVATDKQLDAASNQEMIDLTGKTCVGGVDYSMTNDFTSCLLMFKVSGKTYIIQKTFVCTRSRDLPGIRAPLEEWRKQGELEYIDEVEIPARVVADWFIEMGHKYNIKRIAIDKFRHSYLQYEFKKVGYEIGKGVDKGKIYLLRRGDNAKIFPLLNSLLINENIVWGHAPFSIMNWYTNNVEIISNGTSFYYGKQEPNLRKTDGFFALVAAMTLAEELETPLHIIADLPIISL